MFITKKHLSRRTVLRGAGSCIALPLLDAMLPAGVAFAKTGRGAPAHRVRGLSARRRDEQLVARAGGH